MDFEQVEATKADLFSSLTMLDEDSDEARLRVATSIGWAGKMLGDLAHDLQREGARAMVRELVERLEDILKQHAEEDHPDRDRSPHKPFLERRYVQDALETLKRAKEEFP